jgi:NitT/TauT family transport system substrate-binding protein
VPLFLKRQCDQTQAGLEVALLSPDSDAAPAEGETPLTPARKVERGFATFAVGPSESAISYHTTDPDKPKLRAVAALLQGSTSAISVLADSGIDRPAQLAGKRYASYDGRFEDRIVEKLVANDGGDGKAVQFHSLDFHGYADPETTVCCLLCLPDSLA